MAISVPLPTDPRETLINVISVVGSLVLNLCGIVLGGHFLAAGGSATGGQANVQEELVMSLEELIPQVIPVPPEEAQEPEQKGYLSTDAKQESPTAPANARFESDRNTVAMTEKPAADPAGEAVPTQDGEKKIPFMDLQEHRYKDGEDGEIPRTPQVAPGMPVMPALIPKIPGEESKEPVRLEAPNDSENKVKQPDEVDPQAKQFAEMKPVKGEQGAEKRPLEPGKEGGAAETLEMANVDLAKVNSPLADKLKTGEEGALVMPDRKDSMPERNPDSTDPANPQARAPLPNQPPSAPLRAQPISRQETQEVMAPLPPGAMASQPTLGTADQAAFSPEHHRNQMKGSLSNVGRTSALDAEATPLGQYKKLVNRAIERRWHQLRIENADFLSFGSLRISFEVRRDGRVHGLRVLHEDANAVMTSFTLQAINSAKIPPMPPDIVSLIGSEGLEATYDIIIY